MESFVLLLLILKTANNAKGAKQVTVTNRTLSRGVSTSITHTKLSEMLLRLHSYLRSRAVKEKRDDCTILTGSPAYVGYCLVQETYFILPIPSV